MTRIIVHIDSLLLRGFPQEDRQALAAGLQQELERLLATPQAAQRVSGASDASRLRIAAATLSHGLKPQSAGRRIGHLIGKEISK